MNLKQGEKENYEYKTAEQIKEIADQKNIELIDIKKETEKTLRKVLDTVEMMAKKGSYSTSYICDKAECDVIENVVEGLQKLGFRTQVMDFTGTKAISIKWDLEDNIETKTYTEGKKENNN